MRFFNTAGACEPDRHYMVPAAERLPEARKLLDRGSYFVLHAPRQTGKTTTLRALADEVTREGRFCALHLSCKPAEPAGADVEKAQLALLDQIRLRAGQVLPPELRPPPWPAASTFAQLQVALAAWAAGCPRPLVLFFDEIDALYGTSLEAVLSQLHAAYPDRPRGAPWSVALCGLREVRDYREAAGRDPGRLGSASPFNVQVKSIRLSDFSETEVRGLYAQHTADTGQPFTEQALSLAWSVTRGQPWLVNALAREIIEEMGLAPPLPIEEEHVEAARERLIRARATHLDSLAAKLYEGRVRGVLEPMIAGTLIKTAADAYDDDVQYVRDLGLLAQDDPLRISNPIYREVIIRVLTARAEPYVRAEARGLLTPDGRLDVARLLREFAEFFREHGEVLEQDMVYHEAAPHLVLMAFLQRLVNGGGQVVREYGLGRGRIDLLIRWPHAQGGGRRAWQKVALELKVWREKKADPLPRGLVQLDEYWDRVEPEQGVLVIFDRRPGERELADRIALGEERTPKGRAVHLLRA